METCAETQGLIHLWFGRKLLLIDQDCNEHMRKDYVRGNFLFLIQPMIRLVLKLALLYVRTEAKALLFLRMLIPGVYLRASSVV